MLVHVYKFSMKKGLQTQVLIYSGPEVMKLFHAQLNMKFIKLISAKMPTILG